MLDASIFAANMHVRPAEMFGTGMHRYDIYVLRGATVIKYTSFGQDYKEAIQAFCYRFQLVNRGKRHFTNGGITAYRLKPRSLISGAKVCDDCVIKMMV